MELSSKALELKKKLHKAEEDLIFFAQEFISKALVSKYTPDFHRELYKLISKLKGFNLIVAPRGHAKSTACSVIFPLWCAMYGHRKDIIIVSASQGLSVDLLRKIKMELDTNKLFNGIGWRYKTAKWSENHIQIRSLKGDIINVRALGAGGQTRGWRPDLFILDDIENDEGVQSLDQRKKLKEWLNKAVIGTLLPEGQIVAVGTILHHDSMLQNILDQPLGWTTKFYQAYIDAVQDEDHVLWKEQFNHKQLQERKAIQGSWAFSSEYLNIPVSQEDAPFKPNDIRYFEELPDKYSMVVTLDPAYTEGNQSDYKVCVVIARDMENNRYLADYTATKLPMNDYMQSALNLILKYKNKITSVGMPSGREIDFWNKFIEFCASKGHYFNFVELKNTSSLQTNLSMKGKSARIIASLQGLFQQGKYYLRKSQELAIDQLATFPRGKHDDIIDAMSYAEQIIMPVYFDTEGDDPTLGKEEPVLNRGICGYDS